MADFPKYKVFIEGIKVPVQTIIRVQTEGESSEVILYLWPTNKGTQIARGSFVVIFREEKRNSITEKTYGESLKGLDSKVTSIWELFWDGYIDRKPSISRKESRSLVLYCQQWSYRLNSMYMRAYNLSMLDLSYNQDRAFMGINLEPNGFFDSTGLNIQSNISAIEQKIISSSGGIGAGLLSMIKEAVNWDELYARVEAVANIYRRFTYSENPTINLILQRENLAHVIAGQVGRMSASTTLMKIINQIMYQTLYTFISVPSPTLSQVTESRSNQSSTPSLSSVYKLNQFIYKPQLFFAVPILSNLIFPGPIDSMEPINTRVDQPTRVMIESNTRILGVNTSQIITNKEFFPEKVAKRCANYKTEKEGNFLDKFTDEEFYEERLVPGRINMPFPDGLMHLVESQPEDSIAKVYGRYMYEIERNVSEPIRIQMNFDPYLICGLSAAVFDDQFGYIMGRIRTIQDTIDILNQTSKTQIEFVNVRILPGVENGVGKDVPEEDFQIENYDDLFGSSGNYAIFDDRFNNDNIGDKFYKVVFGINAVNNTVADKSISDSMKNIYNGYASIGESSEEYIMSIKHRPVVTEAEYMKFINAKPSDGGTLNKFDEHNRYKWQYNKRSRGRTGSGDSGIVAKPFMKERQEVIIQYIEDIENAHLAKIA